MSTPFLEQDNVSIDQAKTAVVSIHEGWKYHGSLGTFLRDNKQTYAKLHGYAYIDTFPSEEQMIPLQPWQMKGNRAVYYKKPRFLLSLMEGHHADLEWLLWIDGDAIVTQPYLSIEEKVSNFMALHKKKKKGTARMKSDEPNVCLVWAEDSQPNAGVLLVHNTPTARAFLRTALATWDDTDQFHRFTDQASLTAAIQRNQTYLDCSLLLRHDESTMLQGRVRGPASWRWHPGHWILHLPNHNYLELLSSLHMVGKQLEISPPPVFPPLERPSIDSISEVRRQRFETVQDAIRHSWRAYADTCLSYPNTGSTNKRFLGAHIPFDDLSPISGVGHDWLYHAATLHDSLDTLAIALGTDSYEYKEALDFILRQDLQATALRPTKTFEYSLRIVGGLLGAFSITGDARLLSRARDAVDSLLQSSFASSPTVLPRMFDVLYPPRFGIDSVLYMIYSKIYDWGRDAFTSEHHSNSLAGVGSFSLEFYFLSQMLGVDTYKTRADAIFRHVAKYQGEDGAVPSFWNVMTGEPAGFGSGLGSGSDSFVEYLLKVPLLACGKDENQLTMCSNEDPVLEDMLSLYDKMVQGPLLRTKHIVRKATDESVVYPADNSRYHQLLCFMPGLVALGSSTNTTTVDEKGREDDFGLAESLTRGCHDMYTQTATGLGPESAYANHAGSKRKPNGDRSYLLRPEYVESLFILYRLTGKEEYQEMGWKVFTSLEKYCKVDSGYTGLKDVDQVDGKGRIDDMPSYFIAETLKYLLLLFGPDDFLPLEDFVLTTEAHPLRRQQLVGPTAYHFIQAELASDRNLVPVPFPWLLFAALVSIIFLVTVVLILVARVRKTIESRKLR